MPGLDPATRIGPRWPQAMSVIAPTVLDYPATAEDSTVRQRGQRAITPAV
jgi:hypothetical protein